MFAGLQESTSPPGWSKAQQEQTALALHFCQTSWKLPYEVQHCVGSLLDANRAGPVRFDVTVKAR